MVLAVLLLPLLAAGGVAGYAWWETYYRQPVVKLGNVELADWPEGEPPVNVLLISDSHVSQPDMPPGRLARILRELDKLGPDLVLLAGDYIGHKMDDPGYYGVVDAVEPFGALHPRLGTVAVLGNHDNGKSTEIIAEMKALGIEVLRNRAVKRGPLVIGGMDFALEPGSMLDETLRSMDRLGPAPRILLTHAPDVAMALRGKVDAVMAGHTHCGQIVLPFHGAVRRRGEELRWLACGRLDLGDLKLFVTAGLGTSDRSWRFGADPDVWLIRFGPVEAN
jgi:predicted MPP superfamily phosphohydrolase